MRYGSVCSGIEAATVAWHPLGWEAAFLSEIEPFPCAVLRHHYPDVPNLGDMTKYKEWPDESIDLLVGGTPCQSFSVAGLRKGLADPRGNLMLTFGAIAQRYRPRWLVWENVPGVLSSNRGRDFAAFLGTLEELGYGWAYRILDAQFFGVAQRRRRVFVVGYLGDWRRAAAVLFERESLCGHPAPSRKKGEGVARGVEIGPSGGCFSDVNPTLDARAKDGPIRNQLAGACLDVARSLTRRHDSGEDGTGRGLELIPTRRKGQSVCSMQVRRLTATECEFLQGFPRNYTLIPYRNKPASDGPRYKALGNSMAVPVMRWIGKRVQMVEDLLPKGGRK